jgi:hypothetical protein
VYYYVTSPPGLGQHSVITDIDISAVKRMNMHTKWVNKDTVNSIAAHYILQSINR